MKSLNVIFVLLFLAMLAVPLVFFNAAPGQVSPIDNAQLAELPAASDLVGENRGEGMAQLKSYFQSRLGFRTEMISFYQTLNDRLFDILIHPLYEYGRDKEVFFGFGYEMDDFEYLDLYNAFVAQMDDYCAQRGISFYYALTPPKTLIYEEYLAQGVHYRFRQYAALLSGLRGAGVTVVDMAEPLTAHKEEARMYAVKNDPGHWTEWGAFYGVSEILARMAAEYPQLSPLEAEDFEVSESLITTLPVSYFPIHEVHDTLTPKTSEAGEVSYYNADIRVSPIFPSVSHYVNPQRPDAPRILILHGSHFTLAPKLLKDQFSEALFVFSYGTIFDLPYYVNLFDPDIVLYEAAAQIISDSHYFEKGKLQTVVFQPALERYAGLAEGSFAAVAETEESRTARAGNAGGRGLLTLSWNADAPAAAGYLRLGDRVLDLEREESGEGFTLSVTVDAAELARAGEGALILIDDELAVRQEGKAW